MILKGFFLIGKCNLAHGDVGFSKSFRILCKIHKFSLIVAKMKLLQTERKYVAVCCEKTEIIVL